MGTNGNGTGMSCEIGLGIDVETCSQNRFCVSTVGSACDRTTRLCNVRQNLFCNKKGVCQVFPVLGEKCDLLTVGTINCTESYCDLSKRECVAFVDYQDTIDACQDDGQCDGGYVCVNQECQSDPLLLSIKSLYQALLVGADCDTAFPDVCEVGSFCYRGQCVAYGLLDDTCEENETLSTFKPCYGTDTYENDVGLFCQPTVGKCKQLFSVAIGQPCNENDQCVIGSYCSMSSGRCTAANPNNKKCSESADCQGAFEQCFCSSFGGPKKCLDTLIHKNCTNQVTTFHNCVYSLGINYDCTTKFDCVKNCYRLNSPFNFTADSLCEDLSAPCAAASSISISFLLMASLFFFFLN